MNKEELKISQGFDEIIEGMKPVDPSFNEILNIENDYFGDILDIGCGHGIFLKRIKEIGGNKITGLTGIDISPKSIEVARKNIPEANLIVSPATKLPFNNESFDFVFIIDTFSYVINFEDALREAKRVLKPGGKLIFNFGNKNWIRLNDNYYKIRKKHKIPSCENRFTLKEIKNSLKNTGFKIIKYKGLQCFLYYKPYHKYELILAKLIPLMHKYMKDILIEAIINKK